MTRIKAKLEDATFGTLYLKKVQHISNKSKIKCSQQMSTPSFSTICKCKYLKSGSVNIVRIDSRNDWYLNRVHLNKNNEASIGHASVKRPHQSRTSFALQTYRYPGIAWQCVYNRLLVSRETHLLRHYIYSLLCGMSWSLRCLICSGQEKNCTVQTSFNAGESERHEVAQIETINGLLNWKSRDTIC